VGEREREWSGEVREGRAWLLAWACGLMQPRVIIAGIIKYIR
jgi:hypothetical protein